MTGSRAWCPGCESDTSTLKSAFDNGEECPNCGLGNDAWHEIVTIVRARNDDEMSLRFAELRIENDRLERELKKAREYAARVKAAVGG